MEKLVKKLMEKMAARKELKEQEKALKLELKEIQNKRRGKVKKIFKRVKLVCFVALCLFGYNKYQDIKTQMNGGPQYVSPYESIVADANDTGISTSLIADTYGKTKEEKMVILVNGTEFPATRENIVRQDGSNYINLDLLNTELVPNGSQYDVKIGKRQITVPEMCIIKQDGRNYLMVSELPFFKNDSENGVYTLKIMY